MIKMIKFFNSLTSKKQAFRPLEARKVKMYTCGPTVYDYCHIGNLRSFLFADMLKRFLELEGFDVTQVMNITDVDDKTIKGAALQGKSLAEFTSFYTKEFFRDIEAVRIKRPSLMPKATDNISDMVAMIEKLVENGYAYKEKDGCVYFDISKFKAYGKLSKIKAKELKKNARMKSDQYDKGEARDFALWKAWNKHDNDVFWPTSLGKGRPGWHIECSAMSLKYLGENFDIHTGGTDLKFPHHENEIAQCAGAGLNNFVKTWLHNEHLLVDGRKMSKSLGNFYTLHDITKKGYDSAAFRFLCLSTHYRTQMNFTFKALDAASKTIANINSFMKKMHDVQANTKARKENEEINFAASECRNAFIKAMEDDMNAPLALSALFDMMNIVNRNMDFGVADAISLSEAKKVMDEINNIFDFYIVEEELNEDDMRLVLEREEARKAKDYERADHIRALLKKKGIILEDTPYGVSWRRNLHSKPEKQ